MSTGIKAEFVIVDGNLTSQQDIDEIRRIHLGPYSGAVCEASFYRMIMRGHISILSRSKAYHEYPCRWYHPIGTQWNICGQEGYPLLNLDSMANDRRVILMEEWDHIKQHQIDRLIARMRRRCTECLGTAGAHTHF